MKPFINIHSHVFTAKHAPDFFLKTVLPFKKPWVKNAVAKRLNDFVQRKGTRWVLSKLDWLFTLKNPNYRPLIQRYLEFVKIGTSSTQNEIFNDIANTYAHLGDFKIVVLTQNLDFLDLEQEPNNTGIHTQIEQMLSLKRNELHQQNILPFLAVDPRMKGIDLLEDWVKKYINKDKGFCGIKIYPAYGFFPFDPRLDKVWEWAEENGIPIMSHCTRGGSWYLGRFESIFNTSYLHYNTLDKNCPIEQQIIARIDALRKDKNAQQNNQLWCNIFGHPQNYYPILKRYPNLKICLAHLGGANEVKRHHHFPQKKQPKYPHYFQHNWYKMVKELMIAYPNVYSDISYTLSDEDALRLIKIDFDLLTPDDPKTDKKPDSPLPPVNQLMYGTDFYLTQQEEKGDESDLQTIFFSKFTPETITTMAYDAPARYLANKII